MHAPDADDRAAAALLDDLGRLAESACAECGAAICGHEALFSVALGAKDAARCLGCLAAAMDRAPGELAHQLTEHFRHRPCYSRAWGAACERESQPRSFRPPCVPVDENSPDRPLAIETPAADVRVADTWDAGDMGCGELVLALRIRLNRLAPGSVLQVTARDPAAPEDLPSWCRLTGNALVRADHPVYLIRRKES
jgi:tRNA 2-thiouridine synthesizing protein A